VKKKYVGGKERKANKEIKIKKKIIPQRKKL
jgi:hypothetical protein